MFDNVPEVLQMDSTNKTNKWLSLVAMDQFGHGQPVQYSMLTTTSERHMANYPDHFKRANNHSLLVLILIVDKRLA
ncbi:hypothetical protein F444_21536 [Phytophthora nicotianae P1976]|uniref:ZSWIM1/3 RNaseH-like domain-containing protein n=1 Tax=Phytophthora nicotianae P1976 TaxID=1317066 RepID=A0A080Z0U1_PHYNI|nr:hypothetical protein F444_21536 [Phytophthora nicotianae P1976]